jgi:hypothetical protein
MINYKLLNDSIEFYNSKGFNRIEVPWMVTEYVDSLTRPKDAIPYRVENKKKNFIASGEQGFLYLYLKEYLPKGRFQAITPCMRNDTFDYTHTKYFMKNELIITDDVSWKSVQDITEYALEFFRGIFGSEIKRISLTNGYDIEYKGIELGSYGIRECDFLKWIYGTGCAEPRTSRLLNQINIKEWDTTKKK